MQQTPIYKLTTMKMTASSPRLEGHMAHKRRHCCGSKCKTVVPAIGVLLFVCYVTLLFMATARGGTRTFRFAEPVKVNVSLNTAAMKKNGTLCTYFKQFELCGTYLTQAEWNTFLALFAVNRTL